MRLHDPEHDTAINWTPLSNTFSSNFCSFKLKIDDTNRILKFSPTAGMISFLAMFTIIPLGVASIFLICFYHTKLPVLFMFFALLGILSILTLFMFLTFYIKKITFAPNYFDRNKGIYYAHKPKLLGADEKTEVTISHIQSLQILSKEKKNKSNRHNNKSHTAYQLNMILRDGSRKNIVSHGSYKDIKEDGESLSKLLGISLLERQ